MATERHGPIEAKKTEVPSSPGQATRTQADPRQNQPPSTTPHKSTGAGSLFLIDSTYKTDAEGSNIEGPEKRTLIARLRLAAGLSVRPLETTCKYQVPSIIVPLNEYERGYGRVAGFEDCDPCFLVYRKFGWLHNRLLLHLQDELQVLEEELLRFDRDEAINSNPVLQRCRRKDDGRPESKRLTMLKLIKETLGEYDEILFRLQKLHAIKRPTMRHQAGLYQKLCKNLVTTETKWARHIGDLAALAPDAEHGWFNDFLEDILSKISKKALVTIFRTKEQKIKTGSDPDLILVSPTRFDALLRAFLTLFAAVLLLVPVLILFKLQPESASQVKSRSKYQVLTIFLFTLIASASCSIFTKARKQEVFTATAAYCAVLVVFLGNTSQVMIGSSGS